MCVGRGEMVYFATTAPIVMYLILCIHREREQKKKTDCETNQLAGNRRATLTTTHQLIMEQRQRMLS